MYQKDITILGLGRLYETDKYTFREVSFSYYDKFTEGVKCATSMIFDDAVSDLFVGAQCNAILKFDKVERGNGKYNLVLSGVYLL